MSGLGVLSSSRYGSAMADVSAMSMRPRFELQFAMLQDQVIKRLNTEIEQANQGSGKIDAFLVLEKSRLQRVADGFQQFKVDASRNHNTLADMSDTLTDLQQALDAADAGDTAQFDKLLANINAMTERLIRVNGTTTGIMFDDGVPSLKAAGLVRANDGAGGTKQATAYADFASKADANSAIVAAVNRLTAAQTQTDLKIETVVDLDTTIGKRLTEVTLEIEAAKTAGAAEKTAAIAKLKEKYGQMLNAMSLAFEANAAMTNYLANSLLAPAEVQKGSVMNLFT